MGKLKKGLDARHFLCLWPIKATVRDKLVSLPSPICEWDNGEPRKCFDSKRQKKRRKERKSLYIYQQFLKKAGKRYFFFLTTV